MWSMFWCPCVKTQACVSPTTPIFIPTTRVRRNRARRISPLLKIHIEHGPIDNRNAEQTDKRKQQLRSIIISNNLNSAYYRNIENQKKEREEHEEHEQKLLRIKSIIDNM